jgi:beta-lactamase regulating signal transducer with metallopeptidase domain
MHTLLGLSSMLPILFGGFLALGILRWLAGWSRRRDLQLLILVAPVASLGLSVSELYHLISYICFIRTPPWDYILSMALPLGMGLVAVGGVSLGVVRLALMAWVVDQSDIPLDSVLQELSDDLAKGFYITRPRVLLYPHNRPLALTIGLWQPTILLSTWMVEHLDQYELEAVLTHELGHVTRRDYLVIWLATILRDAFCYLPTSWFAYRQLQNEKELACDDLVIATTHRPLALASALAKIWQYAVARSNFGLAQPLEGGSQLLKGRIERLLTPAKPLVSTLPSRMVILTVGVVVFSVLVLVAAANITLTLEPLECGPAVLIWRLLS